jgi:DNA-binding NarL/FixJ family response regulator
MHAPRRRPITGAMACAAAPAEIRLFVCDDAVELRALLRLALESEEGVSVVGEAGSGEGLTEAVLAAGANVVLLDLSMPGVDGLEALPPLRAAAPGLAIVVLSGYERERMEARTLALGADRYLEKHASLEQVRLTVHQVAAERTAP